MATLPKTPPPFLYSIKNPSTYCFYSKRTLPFTLFSNKPFPHANIILNMSLALLE